MPPIDENEQTQDLSDEQIDQLVDSTEQSTNHERPMSQEEATPPAAAAAQTPDAYEFQDAAGNKFKATREEILKWREQVSGLPQRLQKINQEKMAWEQQKSQWEKQYAPYREIDQWASKNPDKWEQLKSAWQGFNNQTPSQQADPNNPYAQKIQMLEAQLQQVTPVIQTLAQNHQQSVQQAEDQKLEQEIQSIQEKYKDLDWKTPNEEGKSLEYQVLEHAQKNGIKKFDTAFKDFYHDKLIERERALAQQSVAKGIQAKTKMGILGESPTPRKGLAPVKDVKNKSYEDLMREALEEIQAG